jgi:hypothetical protein
MSIRNLGSWDPLGLDSDPVYADPDAVADAQSRYQNIATTINDAVAKLQQIVDTNSESLAGQYVSALQKNAQTILTDLTKAGVRYSDVASQIQIYEPALNEGLSETAAALTQAESAVQAQSAAQGLPNPQPTSGQTLTADQQQQQTSRTNAINSANDDLSAAKSRLSNAMDSLDVAGKRFGDAVSAKNYKDGLTDTWKDRLDVVLGWFSKIFGAIGMALAGLSLLIPGLDVVVLAGVVVGAAQLLVNSILLANGQGSILDVVMGAVGLGGVFAQLGKNLAADARTVAGLAEPAGQPSLEFRGAIGEGEAYDLDPMTPAVADDGPVGVRGNFDWLPSSNAATKWSHVSDWFNNPLTNPVIDKLGGAIPELGFWASAGKQINAAGDMWAKLGTDPIGFASEFGGVLGGLSGFRNVASVAGAVGGRVSPLWYVWGASSGSFTLGVGFGYTGGRLSGRIPAVH